MSATIANRVEISAADFVSLMMATKRAERIGFIAATEPRLRAGNPFSGLRKISHVGGGINGKYADAVNRERELEGMVPDFVAEPRKWGERIAGTPLVTHNGRWYLEVRIKSSKTLAFIMPDLSHVDPAEVEKWLPNRHSGRQGIKNAVIIRDFAVDNLRSVNMKKMRYIID